MIEKMLCCKPSLSCLTKVSKGLLKSGRRSSRKETPSFPPEFDEDNKAIIALMDNIVSQHSTWCCCISLISINGEMRSGTDSKCLLETSYSEMTLQHSHLFFFLTLRALQMFGHAICNKYGQNYEGIIYSVTAH